MRASAPRLHNRLFEHLPRAVAAVAAAVGALVLVGWFFDATLLKGGLPGWTLVKANTAMAMVLCGVALWATQASDEARRWQLLGQGCSGIALLLGLLTLGEYLSGRDFGIDQLLIQDITTMPGDIPGRMAISTALSLAAAGVALLLVIRGKGRFITGIHALLLVPLVVAGTALIGYGYDIEEILRERFSHTPMAPPTAVLFILLTLGIASARPEYPFRRFIASESAAGAMVRRLLPAVIVLTLAIGLLIARGYNAGQVGAIFALALFSAASIGGLSILVLWSARTFDRADTRRKRAEEELRAASLYARSLIEASLDPLVTISAQGKITDVNEATEQATGLAREALIGSDFSSYFTELDKARAGYQEAFANGSVTDYPLAIRHTSGTVMEVLCNARVYHNPQGEVAGIFAAARDITERKKNEAVNAVRMRLIEFALTHTLDELLEETLNETERLTGSLIGFYHFVEEDQNSLTLQTWSTRTKAEFCRAEGKGLHYPIDQAGVWADCVRQGKPVIHNDYASLPNRKGMPPGHATVIRELVVPVRRGNKISAILGVGNKATDYTPADIEAALLVADLTGEIAARKRAEDALRESSERIRDLYNNAPNGYLSADANGIVTEMNDTLLHWLQYSREEIIGKPLGKFLTAEGVKAAETATKILQERGWTRDDAYDLVRKDGSTFPVLASSTPVMGPDGKLLVSRCSVFDNTERKRAEEQLRAASLYARSLIEASPDPLVTISAEGKVTDVNEATIRATGVSREQLVGSDFSDYFTEPDQAGAGYQEAFAQGFVKDYPLALRHASGSVIEVLYNASLYRDEQGAVAGVFAAARDVTELKRTEKALKERVKELQTFYHLSELAARANFSLESLCRELVNTLPQSWQYPEIACARIIIRGSEFRTANFSASAWTLAAPISALGEVVGKIEVGYLEQKPDEDEGPFFKEERQLIDAIAERIGQITELKRADSALKASEELLRALANATSEGILIHEHGRIVEANRQMEDILGRPRAEIVGAPVLDFVAPRWRDMVVRRVEVPEDTRVEFAFLRPDGSEVLVSGLAHPCVYLGRPMRVAVYRDITLEKWAEEAIRNVGIYNRSLIEVSLDPLVTISPDGKITDVNEATIQATGMPRSLLLGSDFSSYFTEPDKARAGYQEVFAKGFIADYPLSLRHVSGRTIDVLYNASVYRNAKGEVAGVFAAARDITERKRAEDELRHYHEHLEELVLERTSKLNAVNKDLEEFIYSMAHDLGIPLRAVNGFAHILLTEYRDNLDDEGKRYLDVVQDNTRRMGRLIDDILAFSRLRSAEITVSEINMEELAHEGLDELRPTFAGRELNVEIKTLPSARGDRTMLRQVWVNLLSNAIKFTREKSPARIEVGCVEKETELVYYVKDNGAGFDMQYANKLFGVFQRLHGVEEFEGQGIGLAMVKRIVTRHGGRVWAEGKPNEGATIYFALPAKGQEHG